LDQFSEELRTNFWWLTLHGLCSKRKEQSGSDISYSVKMRVEKKAAEVPSSGCSQEYNLQSYKTENRAD